MSLDWFIVRDGKESGPFSAAQLKQLAATGALQPDEKVRRGDMQAATKASAIKGLFTATPASTAASPPHSTTAATPPAGQKAAGPSKRTAIIASAAGGAFLLLCCGGLGVVGILAPKKPDTTKSEVADGGAPANKAGKSQPQPQIIRLDKGWNREPLELRVLATDEIEVFNNPSDGLALLTGFSVNFNIHWLKSPDKANPSWPWRYTIYTKKGEKIGEGQVGRRDKSHRPYDAQTQSGQTVICFIDLNRNNFEDAARIDIHRGDSEPNKIEATQTQPTRGPERHPSGSEIVKVWKGGTIAEFISEMQRLSREEFPRVGWLTFDPDAGKACSLTRDEAAFSTRFGPPSQDILDSKKAENSKVAYRDRFRLWTYQCKDGRITLHVEPTTLQITSGNWIKVLSLTVEPADCVRN